MNKTCWTVIHAKQTTLHVDNYTGFVMFYLKYNQNRTCYDLFEFISHSLYIRGLAVMRPACHLDTQNTVFDSLDTQNVMSELAEDDFS